MIFGAVVARFRYVTSTDKSFREIIKTTKVAKILFDKCVDLDPLD